MQKIKAVKFIARLVVGTGTTTISHSIIRNNVSPSNPIQSVSVAVAALVIGSMSAEATRSYTDTQIDEFVTMWNNATNPDTEEPVSA